MNAPSEAILKQGWSKDLPDCVPGLIAAYPIVASKFMEAHPELWMRCDYTWRSKAFQFELFKKGRRLDAASGLWVIADSSLKVTNNDGVSNPSFHNFYPSQALDFIIFRDKTPIWSSKQDVVAHELYAEVGHLFEDQGIVSGAFWKWPDPGHVQIKS